MEMDSQRFLARTGQLCLIGAVCVAMFSGCLQGLKRDRWRDPEFSIAEAPTSVLVTTPRATAKAAVQIPPPATTSRTEIPTTAVPGTLVVANFTEIQGHYRQARELEQQFSARCLDQYFRAAVLSWPIISNNEVTNIAEGEVAKTWEIYHSSVAKLVSLGQKYRQLTPTSGLRLGGETGVTDVGTSFSGFPWLASDFQRLVLVGDYSASSLRNQQRSAGIGVPLVVEGKRIPEPAFMRPEHSFAATVVLQPSPPSGEWTLAFYDPLRVSSLSNNQRTTPIARDLSAPFVYRLSEADRSYIAGLLRPGRSTEGAQLSMIEPYQPGKIPLIFVHGLASDRFTWANMANDLRAETDLISRYQIWAFEYPTGRPFPESAADLREQLLRIRQVADPSGQDPALEQMVLVGHSMGGLVSKLQITYSDQRFWKSVSNEPLERVRMDAETRLRLERLFFFEPVPSVRRVVFIGTPHQGSSIARRWAGRVTSSLVRVTEKDDDSHARLIENNPGVFTREIRGQIPNSVDLLEPQSGVLRSIYRLRVSKSVQLHSIIGTGRPLIGSGAGDGVVPVSSARHPGASSELLVNELHQNLQKNAKSINELFRILRLHAQNASLVSRRVPSREKDSLESWR
jgi:pimeloyl-ACP methyl ester carboxylesterase